LAIIWAWRCVRRRGPLIGRQKVQQQKGDDRHAEQHGDRLQQPLASRTTISRAPLRRVEQIAQRVADKIERERGGQNERARDEDEPRATESSSGFRR